MQRALQRTEINTTLAYYVVAFFSVKSFYRRAVSNANVCRATDSIIIVQRMVFKYQKEVTKISKGCESKYDDIETPYFNFFILSKRIDLLKLKIDINDSEYIWSIISIGNYIVFVESTYL